MTSAVPPRFSVVEDDDSLARHREQQTFLNQAFPGFNDHEAHDAAASQHGRSLRKPLKSELALQEQIQTLEEQQRQRDAEHAHEVQMEELARQKHMAEMISKPGIKVNTVHALIIDAGSTGSRMHVYEFAPRILETRRQVDEAVSGNRLSFPGTESRWTERLRPGLNAFAPIEDDDELYAAVADYLSPLLEFAQSVLHSKQAMFEIFPIYLKATGGMRTLPSRDRQRLMGVVRSLFQNNTFCPFRFEEEFARVISGEEEAIYGWAGVNFLMGSLLDNSEGVGTVIDPVSTYGALDLGGASTQISFYDPAEDIMSQLFKLQIGASKHWNIYTHSFLYFGVNAAYERLNARLYYDAKTEDVVRNGGVYNPCLPGKTVVEFKSQVQIGKHGVEAWPPSVIYNVTSDEGMYSTIMRNDQDVGDFKECYNYTTKLLRGETNAWCNFEHREDCSFAGVYQPPLPTSGTEFGYFVGFSNIHHTFDFLNLDAKSSLQQLHDGTEKLCAMSLPDLQRYNMQRKVKKRLSEDDLPRMCFLSSYVLSLLHKGYGFDMNSSIYALHQIDGHKVTWALGSIMYEVNTLPWQYEEAAMDGESTAYERFLRAEIGIFATLGLIALIFWCYWHHENQWNRLRSEDKDLGELKPIVNSRDGEGDVEVEKITYGSTSINSKN